MTANVFMSSYGLTTRYIAHTNHRKGSPFLLAQNLDSSITQSKTIKSLALVGSEADAGSSQTFDRPLDDRSVRSRQMIS